MRKANKDYRECQQEIQSKSSKGMPKVGNGLPHHAGYKNPQIIIATCHKIYNESFLLMEKVLSSQAFSKVVFDFLIFFPF